MPVFTFEIIRQGDAARAAHVLTLSDDRAVWPHVEALALRIQNPDNTFIRVKDSAGAIVVRAGVATALASIEKCSCGGCPIKREWGLRQNPPEFEQRVAAAHRRAADFSLPIQCRRKMTDTHRAIKQLEVA